MNASGTGSWVALPSNPSATNITNPASPTTTITGFTVVGAYRFAWGTAIGDTVQVIADTSFYPSVSITTVTQPVICSGMVDTFIATPTNGDGGASPTYQWNVNGANMGNNSNVFITSFQTIYEASDSITVIMTSSLACANNSAPQDYAGGVSVAVNPTPAAPLLTLAGGCLGTDSLVLSGIFDPLLINWYQGTLRIDTQPFFPYTVAGNNGQGAAANQLYNPSGVLVDGSGNIYVADYNNNRIQKFPAGGTRATNGVTVQGQRPGICR